MPRGMTSLSPATPEGELAAGASYVAVLREGQLVLEGAPGDVLLPTRSYTVTVPVNGDAFRAALAANGIEARGGPPHFGVVLPPALSSVDILRAASAARAPVLELVGVLG